MSSNIPNGLTNEKGQGASHASQSSVPGKVQDKAPKGLEDQLPDAIHDTGSNSKTGKVSHATGDSKVRSLPFVYPMSMHVANILLIGPQDSPGGSA
jgi:hypothetical protein